MSADQRGPKGVQTITARDRRVAEGRADGTSVVELARCHGVSRAHIHRILLKVAEADYDARALERLASHG